MGNGKMASRYGTTSSYVSKSIIYIEMIGKFKFKENIKWDILGQSSYIRIIRFIKSTAFVIPKSSEW